jgi:hypothetical protein
MALRRSSVLNRGFESLPHRSVSSRFLSRREAMREIKGAITDFSAHEKASIDA